MGEVIVVTRVYPLGAKMIFVLSIADYYVFTPYIYPATWPEDNIFRQAITLLIVTNLVPLYCISSCNTELLFCL